MSEDATPWCCADGDNPYRPGALTCPKGHLATETASGMVCETCSPPSSTAPIVRMRKVTEADIEPPRYQTAGAAGFDLRADVARTLSVLGLVWREDGALGIYPGARTRIPCGYAFEIPPGYEGQVRGRSGLTQRGLYVASGTVDPDYRGEVAVHVENRSSETIFISPGDRVAQMVIGVAPQARLVLVDELSETARGASGFGSTGVR